MDLTKNLWDTICVQMFCLGTSPLSVCVCETSEKVIVAVLLLSSPVGGRSWLPLLTSLPPLGTTLYYQSAVTMKLFSKHKTAMEADAEDSAAIAAPPPSAFQEATTTDERTTHQTKRGGRFSLFKKKSHESTDNNQGGDVECTSYTPPPLDAATLSGSAFEQASPGDEQPSKHQSKLFSSSLLKKSQSRSPTHEQALETATDDVDATHFDADNANNGEEGEDSQPKKRKVISTMVSSVLPKVEPLPWGTFFCLSVWCAVP